MRTPQARKKTASVSAVGLIAVMPNARSTALRTCASARRSSGFITVRDRISTCCPVEWWSWTCRWKASIAASVSRSRGTTASTSAIALRASIGGMRASARRRAATGGRQARRPRSRAGSAMGYGRIDRSSQPVSEQKLEREVEVDMRDAVDRRGIDGGRLEHRHVEERGAPGVGARRPDRHVADEEFRLLAAANGAADHHLHALPIDLLAVLRRRDDRRQRPHVELRIAALDLERG